MWFLDILSDCCACHHVALRRNPWLLKLRYETHAWRHITEFGGREQSRSTTRNKLKIRYTTNPGVLVYSPMLRAWHNNMHSGKRVLRVQSQGGSEAPTLRVILPCMQHQWPLTKTLLPRSQSAGCSELQCQHTFFASTQMLWFRYGKQRLIVSYRHFLVWKCESSVSLDCAVLEWLIF